MDTNNNGIVNLLRLIDKLQKNSRRQNENDTCDRPLLGENNIQYNTRPINIFNCDGSLLTISYLDNGTLTETSTFRVENVDNDYVTVRLLTLEDDSYVNTNETAVINTNCICALKCLDDTLIDL